MNLMSKRTLFVIIVVLCILAAAFLLFAGPAVAHQNPGNAHFDRSWVYLRHQGFWHIDFHRIWYYERQDWNPLTAWCHWDIVKFTRPGGLGSHVDTIRHCI